MDRQVGKRRADIYTSGFSGQAGREVKNQINRRRSSRRGLVEREGVKSNEGWRRRVDGGRRGKKDRDRWEGKENKFMPRRGGGAEKETWKHRRKPHKPEESRVGKNTNKKASNTRNHLPAPDQLEESAMSCLYGGLWQSEALRLVFLPRSLLPSALPTQRVKKERK